MVIQEMICTLFNLGVSCGSWSMEKLLVEYLLVPSAILVIIIYFATDTFMLGYGPTKMKGVLAIIFYIIIVYQGWYSFIAQFFWGFLPLWLLGAIGIFILGRIVKKEWITEGPGKLTKTVHEWKKLPEKIGEGEIPADLKAALTEYSYYKQKDTLSPREERLMGEARGRIMRLAEAADLSDEQKQKLKGRYSLDFW